MESYYFINLIFIFAVNIFFFFSGICLNSLVILSYWRSVQLRKKICYFAITLLSCCDLLMVLTNNPLIIIVSISWLTGKLDVNARWLHISLSSTSSFLVFSFFALLVMNFDRYLIGDILSYLSSNIGNQGKTFNSSCNTYYRRNNFESDACKLPSALSNYLYSFHSCNVIYQLQAVSSRQEKS